MLKKQMFIMVAGPYKSGSQDKNNWKINHKQMNIYASMIFNKGHIPVIGVNMALPIIEVAGDENYDKLMMPISLALASKCDAIFRFGGASIGADKEVEWFIKNKLPIYYKIEDIPISENI